MIKIISSTLLTLAISYSGIAQTKGEAKVYGYVQSVSGGASPDRAEDPEMPNTGGSGTNYFIYLTLGTSSRIYPSEIWIKGDQYGIQTKTITETPVVMEGMDFTQSENQVLVPKTTQKVIQLIPVSSHGVKNSAKAKTLSTTNEVVVVYKLAGKFYYSTLVSLTTLENAAMQ